MSANAFNKSLRCHLKASKNIGVFIAILHFLIAIIVVLMTASLSIISMLLLIMVIISSYFYYYQWHVARVLKKSIVEIHINSLENWSIFSYTGKRIKVDLLGSSFSSQSLIILNFCSFNSKKYTVLITKNMLNEDEFRHLRVRLKTAYSISTLVQ
jgi:hypothetical protein